MDAIEKEFEKLAGRHNLGNALSEIDKAIELLEQARASIEADPDSRPLTLAKLQTPFAAHIDKVGTAHKEIYSTLNKLGKALDKKFKTPITTPLPSLNTLTASTGLLDRAIALHLIRCGHFSLAHTFMAEAGALDIPAHLEPSFQTLYHILAHFDRHNLAPAIQWTRDHAAALDRSGSTLEFTLCRLEFVRLFLTDRAAALRYIAVDKRLAGFQSKHRSEIAALMTAFAYTDPARADLGPYTRLFAEPERQWREARALLTGTFTRLLQLSSAPPLYTATTAGAIALPTLLKLSGIMQSKKTEWTSADELPVEVPLPKGMAFHSIFVCPVSKEQGTEGNPPMMLPCGHVIARESLMRLVKGGGSGGVGEARGKCPYCPRELRVGECVEVVI